MTVLPTPEPGQSAAESFLRSHLAHLVGDSVAGSHRFRGGQRAADEALEALDITGYERHRHEVFPTPRRGASALSPYLRHGMLSLAQVWEAVAGAPQPDVARFRSELLRLEYARHWYARLGSRTATGIRGELSPANLSLESAQWFDPDMACLELSSEELEEDGWIVGQARMWLAAYWVTNAQRRWQDGEARQFRQFIDGSRAANRLNWQQVAGLASPKSYAFSRWQVEQRAAGLCASCDLVHRCPVEAWPTPVAITPRAEPDVLDGVSAEPRRGPEAPARRAEGEADRWSPVTSSAPAPQWVWLTAESLGDRDPALAAHPDLPAVFVFDEPLLASLQLSSKRLIFWVETLAELAVRRPVELRVGSVPTELSGRRVAVTYAPVPGFTRRARELDPAVVYPYPWFRFPEGGSVRSYGAWLDDWTELAK